MRRSEVRKAMPLQPTTIHKTAVKDLGITVDSSLKYAEHINGMTAKALRRVGLMFKCFVTRDHNVLKRAFVTYVRPVLEYASIVFGRQPSVD